MAFLQRASSIVLSSSEVKRIFNEQPTTTLAHKSRLDIDKPTHEIRKTSIICTIGPASNSIEKLTQLRAAGMNLVRLNFSHGTFEYAKSIIDNTRATFEKLPGRPVAICLDTKGPEIRTGKLKDDKDIFVEEGKEIILTSDPAIQESGTIEKIFVDYVNLPKVVKPGKLIFIDDGLVSVEVIETGDNWVKGKVINSGLIGNRKGVNLPEINVDLPALSPYDKECLQFGVENGIDVIFASFIRKPEDVMEYRKALGEKGAHIKIISKIENHEGVRKFAKILEVSDGIMVARGDLGIEIPAQKVFIAQKMMIAQCNAAGKPVICATQMLESMTVNPRPTRAEVSDVANAVLDGADCVMLSGETAKGKFPIEAVSLMASVCLEAESAMFYASFYNEMRIATAPADYVESLACSAVNAALEQNVGGILCLSTSGNTARLCSKYRPSCPIITITRNPSTARTIHLYRGCYPLLYSNEKKDIWEEDVDTRIKWGLDESLKMGLLRKGELVIIIQGWKRGQGHSNTMRIVIVE